MISDRPITSILSDTVPQSITRHFRWFCDNCGVRCRRQFSYEIQHKPINIGPIQVRWTNHERYCKECVPRDHPGLEVNK